MLSRDDRLSIILAAFLHLSVDRASRRSAMILPPNSLTPLPGLPPMSQIAKTVLVAEDDPVFRRVISFSIARGGFAVECAGNGLEAFERLQKGGIDFLVTDQQMPLCTGLELLEKIADSESLQQPPTILCTAKGLELDAIALEERFDLVAVVHKPFSPRKLCQMILQHTKDEIATSEPICGI